MKKSIRNQIASGLRKAGLIGALFFSSQVVHECSDIETSLVNGDRQMAQLCYQGRERYLLGLVISGIPFGIGLYLPKSKKP